MELQHITALVTGGASGMGEATVRHITAAGGKVIIFDMNEEKGQLLAKELGADSVLFFKTNVSDAAEVEGNLAHALERFGSIQVVVNCAGIATPGKVLSKKGPHSLKQFEQVLQVNLVGTFNIIRLAADAMQHNEADVDGQRGVIINTASVAAYEGQIGQAAYSASKGGVISMTLPIARELASIGVRVMTIAPGLVETPLFSGLPENAQKALADLTPFPQRLGKPSEYAQLVESIIQNTMLNGEVIRLDGAVRLQPR